MNKLNDFQNFSNRLESMNEYISYMTILSKNYRRRYCILWMKNIYDFGGFAFERKDMTIISVFESETPIIFGDPIALLSA